MTKNIRTYKELLEEKERLNALLKVQRAVVDQDLRELGETLEPVRPLDKKCASIKSRMVYPCRCTILLKELFLPSQR